MSNFHVGQSVVCVDDSSFYSSLDGLTKGKVYTVREVGLTSWMDGAPCIRVCEIVRPYHPQSPDTPFWARRFRPVRKTSIEVFEAMLIKAPERVS